MIGFGAVASAKNLNATNQNKTNPIKVNQFGIRSGLGPVPSNENDGKMLPLEAKRIFSVLLGPKRFMKSYPNATPSLPSGLKELTSKPGTINEFPFKLTSVIKPSVVGSSIINCRLDKSISLVSCWLGDQSMQIVKFSTELIPRSEKNFHRSPAVISPLGQWFSTAKAPWVEPVLHGEKSKSPTVTSCSLPLITIFDNIIWKSGPVFNLHTKNSD